MHHIYQGGITSLRHTSSRYTVTRTFTIIQCLLDIKGKYNNAYYAASNTFKEMYGCCERHSNKSALGLEM